MKRSANSTSPIFPAEAKERALEMVNNLKEALADRIKAASWMDEQDGSGLDAVGKRFLEIVHHFERAFLGGK